MWTQEKLHQELKDASIIHLYKRKGNRNSCDNHRGISVWERRGLTKETKLKVYQAVVLPSLLYACETWTAYSRHIKQLNAFPMRCLRSLLHIKWQDKVPDTEVLQRAEMESIHAILLRHQLRWVGHVHRMDDCRVPKRLFYGELSTGKRTTGRPKKRYKDTLKEALKLCTIPQATWHEIAVDRAAWRSRVRSGVDDFEERRIKQKEERRQKRKECQNPAPQPDPAHSFPCPQCNCQFRARIGLISHLRTHPTHQ